MLTSRAASTTPRSRARVFSDAEARRALEHAIHPLVRLRFEEIANTASERASERVVVLEATLLVEAGYGPGFDFVVTVEATPRPACAGPVQRGMEEGAARARLIAQGEAGAAPQGPPTACSTTAATSPTCAGRWTS